MQKIGKIEDIYVGIFFKRICKKLINIKSKYGGEQALAALERQHKVPAAATVGNIYD